jgi:acyl-coenzyme A thioesterase PaaI-like protein
MGLYMLKNLPLGFFVGLRVSHIDNKSAAVSVPFKYLNKNPFQSIYFAVLSMAAELSTAILAMASIYDAQVPVSMLVFDMNANFTKKATSRIVFHCDQADDVVKAVEESVATGEGKTVTVKSVGNDTNGEQVAEFNFTWTFKPKKI